MPKTFRENLEVIHAELESLSERASEIASGIERQTSAIIAAKDDITFAIAHAADQITSAVREQTALLDIRLSEINWQLSLQTQALFNIDHTLKTPSETLANEWRARAEELRRRGELKQAEHLFLRCLEPENNPLDYRTYIGLAKTYELLDEPEKALEYYKKSLRHAPKSKDRDWRSYSYLLMGLVRKALLEHQEAYKLSRNAIQLSPMYHAAHYHHARNSAKVEDKESSFLSLWRAAAASPQFLSSALLDNHFDSWRNEIIGFLAQKNTTVNLPAQQYHRVWIELAKNCAGFKQYDKVILLVEKLALYDPLYFRSAIVEKTFEPIRSDIIQKLAQISLKKTLEPAKYHRAWYELAKQCAAFAQKENCIGLLEKVIHYNPDYFDIALADLSVFGSLQEAVQSLLHRLHSDAKTSAKKSIDNAKEKLWSAKEALNEAEKALKKARDKESLVSISSFDKALSRFKLAKEKFKTDEYIQLLEAKTVAEESSSLANVALKEAKTERDHFQVSRSHKLANAWKQSPRIILYSLLGGIIGSPSGCTVGCTIQIFKYGPKGEGPYDYLLLGLVSGWLPGMIIGSLCGIYRVRKEIGADNLRIIVLLVLLVLLSYAFYFAYPPPLDSFYEPIR